MAELLKQYLYKIEKTKFRKLKFINSGFQVKFIKNLKETSNKKKTRKNISYNNYVAKLSVLEA